MRVARETYVHLARFAGDTANCEKGEPPGSPFSFSKLTLVINFAVLRGADGDDACGACDGVRCVKQIARTSALGGYEVFVAFQVRRKLQEQTELVLQRAG